MKGKKAKKSPSISSYPNDCVTPIPQDTEEFRKFAELVRDKYPCPQKCLPDEAIYAMYVQAHRMWNECNVRGRVFTVLELLSSFISDSVIIDIGRLHQRELKCIQVFLSTLQAIRNNSAYSNANLFTRFNDRQIEELIVRFMPTTDITQSMIYDFISLKMISLGESKEIIIAILELLLDDKKHTTTWYELLDMGDEEFARLVTVYKNSGYIEYAI